MSNYNERVALRLSQSDKEALERVSKAKGVNASQYLRSVVRADDRRLSDKAA